MKMGVALSIPRTLLRLLAMTLPGNAALVLFASMLLSSPVRAEYKLGPQDRLKIQVHEWRASLGEVHEWTALRGEFAVSANGTVFLPLLGELNADGSTTAELARTISRTLKDKAGLKNMPDASVEVVQFRPFYILGKVAKPGAYPYQPGLTVLQGLSVAGGLDRSSEQRLMRIDREIISGRSNLAQLRLAIDGQTARRARLQAELGDNSQIEFPPELTQRKGDPDVAKLLADESLLFATRRKALQSQSDSLTALKAQLEGEISNLNAKIVLRDRQLALLKRETEAVTSLVKKGLAVESRQFSLERAEADAESVRLDLDTAVMRARQEISRTERTLLELTTRYRTDLITDLRSTQAKLQEQWEQADLTQKLLYESELTAAESVPGHDATDQVKPLYSISRRMDGAVVEIRASEFDPVAPGDIVTVRLPLELNPNRENPTPKASALIDRDKTGIAAASSEPAATQPSYR